MFSDQLPRQRVPTLIHDHRFALQSRVVRGTLINARLVLVPGRDFEVWHPVSDEVPNLGGQLERGAGGTYGVRPDDIRVVHAGESYRHPARELHQSIPLGTVVTLMRRVATDPAYRPRVLCPAGQVPDNDFRRESAVDHEAVCSLLTELGLWLLIESWGGLTEKEKMTWL